MGERGVRNAEVEGSIPFSSTSTASKEVPGIPLIPYYHSLSILRCLTIPPDSPG